MSVKLNIQQVPKVWGYLSCLEARPLHDLIQLDFAAVEPTVLAQFSGCPNYRKLYGPDANPHQDVYLFVGSKFRKFRDAVTAHYDPENPTAESLARAKKILKGMRAILKEAHLAMQYGAGAATVHSALIRKEVEIEFEDVADMHADYWSADLFAVVKEFEGKLLREWQRNGGWIANGLGVPRALAEDKLKDLLSRFCQSTGHDLLQRLLRYFQEERKRRRLRVWPWIPDYHDETIWEALKTDTEEALSVLSACLERLNNELGWEIKIRGTPQVARNLAEIKCED
jgi:hypothetical protein